MAGRPLPPLVATHILSTLQRRQARSVGSWNEGRNNRDTRSQTNQRQDLSSSYLCHGDTTKRVWFVLARTR